MNKKFIIAIAISASLFAACSTASAQDEKPQKTYVVSNSGGPVKAGGGCLVSQNPDGKFFPECEPTMAKPPEPEVITKVIVDCTKCNGTRPK